MIIDEVSAVGWGCRIRPPPATKSVQDMTLNNLIVKLQQCGSFGECGVSLYLLKLMIFHESLSDSKSPQVSRTLLSILAVLNNAVVWMVFTWPPTSKSSSPFNNPLVTVPKAPIIIVTFMFHVFFQFPSKVEVLILLFTFFQFYFVISRDSKVDNFENSLFCWLLLFFFTTLDFLTSVLTDGFSLEFERQQVSPGFQNSSQYSDRSQ